MKKIHWKSFSLGIVFAIALAFGIGEASAASSVITKSIKATYNNIKIVVNGKQANLGIDSTGKKIEPFIYNGITYLPVRAVSEALGEEVNWDGKTYTVYIGDRPGETAKLMDVANPYSTSYVTRYYDIRTPLSMGGIKYPGGMEFYKKGSYAFSNLQGKYTTLTFDLGTITSVEKYVTSSLNIYLDGKLYGSLKVHSNELPKKVSIPVKGVHQIHFDGANIAEGHDIGIGLPTLSVK